MAIEKVKEYFKKYNMENRVQEFEVSSATVELAAEALHYDHIGERDRRGNDDKPLFDSTKLCRMWQGQVAA